MATVTIVTDADAPWRKNKPPRPPSRIDVCAYCGVEYHPMLRWTHPTQPQICVCEWRYDDSGFHPHAECSDKARADGYTPRRDLTPRR